MTVKSDRKYKSEADGREKSTLRPWPLKKKIF
jgi:hypothetical protein